MLNQAQRAVEGEAPSGFARGGGDASPCEDEMALDWIWMKKKKYALENCAEQLVGLILQGVRNS